MSSLELISVEAEFEPTGSRTTRVNGSIASRPLSLMIERPRLLRSGTFSGNLGTSVLTGDIKGDTLTGTYGPDDVELSVDADGSLARITGHIGDNRIKLEFVRRYRAPFTVRVLRRSSSRATAADLELDPVEPISLLGSLEQVADALAAALVAPIVLDLVPEVSGGAPTWR